MAILREGLEMPIIPDDLVTAKKDMRPELCEPTYRLSNRWLHSDTEYIENLPMGHIGAAFSE